MASETNCFDDSESGDPKSKRYVNVLKNCNNKESVWHYFLKEEGGNTAKCKEENCHKIMKAVGGSTSGLHNHLKRMHKIDLIKRDYSKISQSAEPSSTSTSATQKNKTIHFEKDEKSLSKTLARMTAKDGLPFRVFSTSFDLRQALRSDGFQNLPTSPSTVQSMVTNFSQNIRKQEKQIILAKKDAGQKFSVTFDEWTSNRNRRYINIILHGQPTEIWNLGLVRMNGSMPAEKCLALVERRLNDYNLSVKKDIICIITDGTSTMTKIGKLCAPLGTYQQLCFAHGVQLAVLDVLYKNSNKTPSLMETVAENTHEQECANESSSESCVEDEDDEENLQVDLTENIKPIVEKIRRISRIFRRSPLKNEILQTYVKSDHGKELQLLIDSKTRWNSLIVMLERFYLIRNSVKKALVDVDPSLTVEESELQQIFEVMEALRPVQATVEALCRRDANLITADAALNFSLKKLKKLNTNLSLQLVQSLSLRITQRRTNLSGVLTYLHTGKLQAENSEDIDDTEEAMEEIFDIPIRKIVASTVKDLVNRVSSSVETNEARSSSLNESETPEIIFSSSGNRKKSEIHEELDKVIVNALSSNRIEKPQLEKSLLATIKKEMQLFEGGGQRGSYLSKAYTYVLGVVPTSVESERAFSSSGYLCNKLRSGLSDETLDHLCFLRSYFQNE